MLDGVPLSVSGSLRQIYLRLLAEFGANYINLLKSYWFFFRTLKTKPKVEIVKPYSAPYYIYKLKTV